MKVRMLTTAADPFRTLHAGTTYDLSEKEAAELIAGKFAEPVKGGAKAAEPQKVPPDQQRPVNTAAAKEPAVSVAESGGPSAVAAVEEAKQLRSRDLEAAKKLRQSSEGVAAANDKVIEAGTAAAAEGGKPKK